jgi:hypothetical protein
MVTARYSAARNKLTLITTDFMAASLKNSNWAKLTAWLKKVEQLDYMLSYD